MMKLAPTMLPPLPAIGDLDLATWLGPRTIDHLIASLLPGDRPDDMKALRNGAMSAGRPFATVMPGDRRQVPAELVPFTEGGPDRWRSVCGRFLIVAEEAGHPLYRMHGPVPIPVGDHPDDSLGAARKRACAIAATARQAAWSHLGKGPAVEFYREVLVKLAGNAGRPFRTATWPDPDILFHLRLSTRRLDRRDSRPCVLHVEELYSDWHADGRRFGYSEDPAGEKAAITARIQDLLSKACDVGASLGLDRAVARREGAPPATRSERGHHFLLMCDDSFHLGIHSKGEHVVGSRHAEIKITDAIRTAVVGSALPDLGRTHRALTHELERLDQAPPPAPFAMTWLDLALTIALAEAARSGCDLLATSVASDARAISPIDDGDLERPPESFELLYDREIPAVLTRLAGCPPEPVGLGHGRRTRAHAIGPSLRRIITEA